MTVRVDIRRRWHWSRVRFEYAYNVEVDVEVPDRPLANGLIAGGDSHFGVLGTEWYATKDEARRAAEDGLRTALRFQEKLGEGGWAVEP